VDLKAVYRIIVDDPICLKNMHAQKVRPANSGGPPVAVSLYPVVRVFPAISIAGSKLQLFELSCRVEYFR
jgi:hypothetical protein